MSLAVAGSRLKINLSSNDYLVELNSKQFFIYADDCK